MKTIENIAGHITSLSPYGQIVIRDGGEIVVWNAWMAKASGIDSAIAVGSSMADLFPDLNVRVADSIAQSLSAGLCSVLSRAFLPHPLPLRNRQYRDRTMSQSVTVSGFQSADGCRYCLVNILDVSREVQREELLHQKTLALQETTVSLEAANRELEMFTHMVGHDLRAPLRAVTQFTAFLAEDLGEGLAEDVKRDLEFITGGARRLTNLVDALMRLAMTGQSQLKLSEFPLSDALDVALMALEQTPGWDAVEVTRDELPRVVADHDLLVQVFQNLIGNAAKFVETKAPHIHVTVGQQGAEVVFGVRDNGIGVDPDHAEKVFTPFRRLHAQSDYEGCGIGLAVCSKVIARHGGRIWFDTNCDTGAHVRFTLPTDLPSQ